MALESANFYKEFLLELSEPAFVKAQEEKKNEKKELIKQEWIRRAKVDDRFNDLIFGDDEEIFGDQKYVPEFMRELQ